MTREVAEVVAGVGNRVHPVFRVEDGQVWISGMNASVGSFADRVAQELESAGFDVGEPTDDGAAEHGGLLVPVAEAEELTDAEQDEVLADGA